MAATLKDIARFARVAPSTASYVLGGTGLHKVGKETQRRIFEAAAKLDYRRNINAQGLSTGRSFMIGVLIQQLSTSFLPEVLEGLEEELQRHNYGILLTSFSTLDELEKLVNEISPTSEFKRTMLAEEYRQSLSLSTNAFDDFEIKDNQAEDDEDEELRA